MKDTKNESQNYDSIDIPNDPEQPKVDLNTSDATNKDSSSSSVSSKVDEVKEKAKVHYNALKNYFKKAISQESSTEGETENSNNFRTKALTYIQDKVEVETSYKTFITLISIGSALFCLSLFFLPLVIVSPRKFVSLFSIGNILILLSFLFVYGTKTYFEKLFSKERFILTALFICSITAGIFCAIINSYYFLSLICAGIQLLSLVVFILSFIPGGQGGISAIWKMITSPVTRLFSSSS